MMSELSQLWTNLHDPEYLHLVLEPLPLFGLGLGLIFLLMSQAVGHKQTRMLALAVIIVSAASVHWYLAMRVRSEARVVAMTETSLHSSIKQQTTRRQDGAWVYYMVAGAATVALMFGNGERGSLLVYAVAMVVAAGFVHALWLHRKESEVYHRNIIRYVSPK